jgi:hypothetical protein
MWMALPAMIVHLILGSVLSLVVTQHIITMVAVMITPLLLLIGLFQSL